jgi:hypothetical protein
MVKNEKVLISFTLIFSIIIILIITSLYLLSELTETVYKSILLGTFLAFINFSLGFLLIQFSIDKSDKIFLLVLWGGFLFRLILGLTFILIILIFLEINTYGFIFSILFFYVFYLIIEIFYLNLGRNRRFGRN